MVPIKMISSIMKLVVLAAIMVIKVEMTVERRRYISPCSKLKIRTCQRKRKMTVMTTVIAVAVIAVTRLMYEERLIEVYFRDYI